MQQGHWKPCHITRSGPQSAHTIVNESVCKVLSLLVRAGYGLPIVVVFFKVESDSVCLHLPFRSKEIRSSRFDTASDPSGINQVAIGTPIMDSGVARLCVNQFTVIKFWSPPGAPEMAYLSKAIHVFILHMFLISSSREMLKMATPARSGAPLFLLVVLVAAFAMSTALASDNSVTIINDVGVTIQVHCKSGDRDLHPRTLLSGQRFGWGFKSNF